MKKVAIYCRVSTTNQAEDGYSISEQQDKLNKYCEIMGWQVSEIYTDAGFSGSNIERPAIQNMIYDAKSHKFDTVLVYKLDRLSRSTRDNLFLIQDVFKNNNVEFISLNENIDTSSAMGGFFLTILAAFAELERETIKERMQLGKLGRIKSGKSSAVNNAALGYKYDKSTDSRVIVPTEAKLVQEVFERYSSGDSISRIVRDFLTRGITGKNGGHITPTRIRNILSNEVYIGKQRYQGKIYDATHEPIITEEMFYSVQKELEIKQNDAYKKGNSRPFQAKYMLSGLLKCGYCGSRFDTYVGKANKAGEKTVRYVCRNRKTARAKFSRKDIYDGLGYSSCPYDGFYYKQDLEDIVINEILEIQYDKDKLKNLISEKKVKAFDEDLVKNDILAIQKKVSRLNDLYLVDAIDLDELKVKVKNLKQKEKNLEQILINNSNKQQELKMKEFKERMLLSTDISSSDYEIQKNVVRTLISSINVKENELDIVWKL